MSSKIEAEDIDVGLPQWIVGEYRLGVEILLRAIEDVEGGVKPESDEMDALEWIFSPSKRPFGFMWWCDHLGISPRNIRSRLKGAKNEREKSV